METLVETTKKKRFPNNSKLHTSFDMVIKKPFAMTRGWQCCECKETMYNDEMHCTWDRCNHRRCKNCRSFTN